jgi:hypothetical protein
VRSLVLGLAHVRLEAKRHNGFLKASLHHRLGTAAYVTLPVCTIAAGQL